MIKMDDICFTISENLENNGFFQKNIECQKEMFDIELKDYLLKKIDELSDDNKDIHVFESTNELVETLGTNIPKEEHDDTLRYLIFVIMMVVASIQRKDMTWNGSVDPNSTSLPVVEFDEYGNWIKLNTHEDDSYVETFNFAYGIFKNEFKKKVKGNIKTMIKH